MQTILMDSPWFDERIFPAYVVAVSILSLIIRAVVTSKPVQRLRAKRSSSTVIESNLSVDSVVSSESRSVWLRAKEAIKALGGPTIFTFKVVRLALVVALWIQGIRGLRV